MKIINLGSINIDHVYRVEHFVRPGETIRSEGYSIFSGGKGANQSLALARAGAKVFHAGKIGHDGIWLKDKLQLDGVDTDLIETVGTPTGHALIQVDKEGENAIITHAGANDTFTQEDIDTILDSLKQGDYLLLQNEINGIEKVLEKAKDMSVIFNPAPMTDRVKGYPLEHVDIFIINETEGKTLTLEEDVDTILNTMQKLYPSSKTVLTLGEKGLIYSDQYQKIKIAGLQVTALDTTGAGDTFTGYFIAELLRGSEIRSCLEMGVKASALCVTREGAGDSIPKREEVENYEV